jgi:hypothetical protein
MVLQVDKTGVASPDVSGLDDEQISRHTLHSLKPAFLWLSNICADLTIMGWNIRDLVRGGIGNVDNSLSIIADEACDKQDKRSTRNLKIARLPASDILEVFALNGEDLCVSRPVNVRNVKFAFLGNSQNSCNIFTVSLSLSSGVTDCRRGKRRPSNKI